MDEQMDVDSGLEPGLLTEVQLKALIQNVRGGVYSVFKLNIV
jgi:hypothetical protein